jgi:hypothetical protein
MKLRSQRATYKNLRILPRNNNGNFGLSLTIFTFLAAILAVAA